MKSIHKICVVGAGRLGAPIAATLAAKGFQVIAADTNRNTIESLRRGRPPVYEANLQEMIEAAGDRLTATTDVVEAVKACDATFILVPTPSDRGGGFRLDHVLSACTEIGRALAAKTDYHLVSLVSTVMPGATGGPVREQLERTSGRRAGEDLGLCYSPEFVALGSVIRDYLNPDFVLVGHEDPRAADMLGHVYDRVCEQRPPKAVMNWVNAELTKLAVNTYVTTKITFANMLANICEGLEGADVDRVTSALGLDSRIGRRYLSGGLGYGGPCFPRDGAALVAAARTAGASAKLAEAVDSYNRDHATRLADTVMRHLPARGTVGILGLAYKPHSDVVEQSQGLLLAETLVHRGARVTAYDPAAMDAAGVRLGLSVRMCADSVDCVEASDLVVIATPWPQFAALSWDDLQRGGRPRILLDPWRILEQASPATDVVHIRGGVGPRQPQTVDGALSGAA